MSILPRVADRALALAFLTTAAAGPLVAQPSTTDTRLLSEPAISADQIAFAYAGDLWTARQDGSDVRRLTSAQGDEQHPVYSPDGRWIAFAGNYDGNVDVYLIPAAGGEPKRLTWHPGADIPQSFTADGKAILFTSNRADFSGRYTELWSVPVGGGSATELPIPNAAEATVSPDGRHIAYNPIGRAFEQWKGYRGGQASALWLIDTSTWEVEKIPQPEGRCNDVDAVWLDPNTVWFRSDRDGEFNLYRYDRATKKVSRVTNHTDFPIQNVAGGAGKILYEQAGWLHLFDPATSQSKRLVIGVAADLKAIRPHWVKGAQYVRNLSLSPSAARVAVETRGEIVTVPAEKGDPRNLTRTTGAHEREPAWSPDGTQIAYLSDEGGEYRLHLAPQDGKGAHRVIPLGGAGFYFGLQWSPDGKKIAYWDNSQTIFILDVASGKPTKVAANQIYTPAEGITYGWSPDSKWLAYTVLDHPLNRVLYLYDVAAAKSTAVTDGLSEVANPTFDKSGKYLYVLASTDGGPQLDWFAQSGDGLARSRGIYAIALAKSAPNPFAPQSDEEKPATPPDTTKKAAGSGAATTTVDFDGITQRIVAFPIGEADITQLEAGDANQVYYLRRADAKGAIHRYDLSKRKDEALITPADGFDLSRDGKKLFYNQGPEFFLTSTAQPLPGQGKVSLDAIDLYVDPPAEWAQELDEAWRINRDYFYATNYHGVNWPAQRTKYAALVAQSPTREDTYRIISWLLSELRVGHSFTFAGPGPDQPKTVPGGLLGADYEVANGRYRIAKVYGGLNWNPGLRSPLAEPGVDVQAGEYLLAVNGVDLRPPTSVYAPFENTAGKTVELTVGTDPSGAGSRTVTVVPIPNEFALRHRAWVEGNLHKVDSATGGRVAYVYVPNTTTQGYESFRRYFYPQAHKDALIVDERFNGGGQLADYYIDIMKRQTLSYWATRYGHDLRTPAGSIPGPKALLINQTAGSGGDYFPWMFRHEKIGPLIGKRTWGGLVGILGTPVLMDGGAVTAPNLAIWTPDGGYIVENVGVPPDIEVEQTPKDVIAGHDPQLERAIAWVMDELRKNPPPTVKRPPYPDKVHP
jgi:tricorn protease